VRALAPLVLVAGCTAPEVPIAGAPTAEHAVVEIYATELLDPQRLWEQQRPCFPSRLDHEVCSCEQYRQMLCRGDSASEHLLGGEHPRVLESFRDCEAIMLLPRLEQRERQAMDPAPMMQQLVSGLALNSMPSSLRPQFDFESLTTPEQLAEQNPAVITLNVAGNALALERESAMFEIRALFKADIDADGADDLVVHQRDVITSGTYYTSTLEVLSETHGIWTSREWSSNSSTLHACTGGEHE
jgi:hypothetical protein